MIERKTGESRDQIESFLQHASKEGGALKDRVVNTAQEYASAATEGTQQYAQQVADAAQSGYDETRKAVKRRPMESLAVFFGIGLITGVVAALTMRSR